MIQREWERNRDIMDQGTMLIDSRYRIQEQRHLWPLSTIARPWQCRLSPSHSR